MLTSTRKVCFWMSSARGVVKGEKRTWRVKGTTPFAMVGPSHRSRAPRMTCVKDAQRSRSSGSREMVPTVAMASICKPPFSIRGIPVPKPASGRSRKNSAVKVRASAAGRRVRRTENVEGEFFVDNKCIDCDVCRWMAPETFVRAGGQSAVSRQPSGEEDRFRALQALLCCPTSSIRTETPPKEIRAVQRSFPLPVDERLPGIYHCGYHSEKTFGATSYLIVHPEGNILVDSPKYKEVLARRIDEAGGVRYMFLTHSDDVGDHQLWSKRFGCERILHSGDVEPSTAGVEMQLFGGGPWNIGTDFELIHTPGHSEGSVCLYYKPLKVLFTGDHLARSGESGLTIYERYNYYSVEMQLSSVQKLLEFEFLWILPGHGRTMKFRDVDEKNSALEAFLASKLLQYESGLVT